MTAIDIVERLIATHGGRAAWDDVISIRASLSSGGLAYASRFQSGKLVRRDVTVYPGQMRVLMRDFPSAGRWAEWCNDSVRIGRDGQGPHLARDHARARFRGWLLHPRWDDLDLAYFVGYALWNYLSFPRLLELPGVAWQILRGNRVGDPSLVSVTFPTSVPTHCSQQYFHLDANGLLRRHDYVAEVFGPWAAGANLCLRSEVIDGLRLYTRRRVVPSVGRSASVPFPTLVWIDLDQVSVCRSERTPTRPAQVRGPAIGDPHRPGNALNSTKGDP